MKSIYKWIIGICVFGLAFFGIYEGIQDYLKGPKIPFNSILVFGEKSDVDEAKKIYSNDTKYTKDFEYKSVEETIKDKIDGKEFEYKNDYILIKKDVAKEMLKENLFRKRVNTSGIITEEIKEIPNLDSKENIVLDSDSFEDVREEKIGNKKIKVRYGFYGWLGLHPQEAKIILVDDKTYNSIDGEIKEVSVIRFNKNKYDLREKDDQGKIKEELKGLTDNIKIGYINLED